MKRNYLSVSALKAFMKSPNHYIAYVTASVPPSPAMELGTAVHCMILEPDEWDKRYAVAPNLDRRTKDGKSQWQTFSDANADKTILTAEQHDNVLMCANAVRANSDAVNLLEGCEYEQRIEAPLYGVTFVGIADAVSKYYVMDLKTCRDASPDQFARDAYNLGYHIQAAAYRMLTGRDRFYWICVETSAPYNVAIYEQSDAAYHAIAPQLKNWIGLWDSWDGQPGTYFAGIQTLNLPSWAK